MILRRFRWNKNISWCCSNCTRSMCSPWFGENITGQYWCVHGYQVNDRLASLTIYRRWTWTLKTRWWQHRPSCARQRSTRCSMESAKWWRPCWSCVNSAGDTVKSYNVDLMLTLRHRQENAEKSLWQWYKLDKNASYIFCYCEWQRDVIKKKEKKVF